MAMVRQGHNMMPMRMARSGGRKSVLRNDPPKTFDIKVEERGPGWRHTTEDSPPFLRLLIAAGRGSKSPGTFGRK